VANFLLCVLGSTDSASLQTPLILCFKSAVSSCMGIAHLVWTARTYNSRPRSPWKALSIWAVQQAFERGCKQVEVSMHAGSWDQLARCKHCWEKHGTTSEEGTWNQRNACQRKSQQHAHMKKSGDAWLFNLFYSVLQANYFVPSSPFPTVIFVVLQATNTPHCFDSAIHTQPSIHTFWLVA